MDTIDIERLSDTYLSSFLPNVEFYTTTPIVPVHVLSKAKNKYILSTRISTFGGTGVIYDIRSVVEQHMRTNLLRTDTITLTVEGVNSITFQVIYCGLYYDGDLTTYLQKHFLTTRSYSFYTRFTQRLYYFAQKDEVTSYRLNITWRNPETGVILMQDTPTVVGVAATAGIGSIAINPAAEAKKLDTDAEILSITVVMSTRNFAFYYTDETPDIHLCYLNPFLCQEHLELFGTTTRINTEEHSEAYIQQSLALYDRRQTETYEFQAAPIPHSTALSLRELLLSPKTLIAIGKYTDTFDMREILILDSKLDSSDEHATLSSPSFTYRFPESRPLLSNP